MAAIVNQKTKETGPDARPQAKNEPEAYPLGYVEDSFEPRTQQMTPSPSPWKVYAGI
jgi:hypothetical protein